MCLSSLVLFVFTFQENVQQNRFLVHITKEDGGFLSTLVVSNPDRNSAGDVSLTFYKSNGDVIRESNLSIDPGETFFATASHLSSSSETSHIKIQGASQVYVTVIYQNKNNGSPVHVLETKDTSRRWQFFQGNWSQTWDGIALTNPNSAANTVEISQYASHTKLSSHNIQIPGMGKQLLVMSDIFSDIEGSYFEIQASEPLLIMALRGSWDGQFMWENRAKELEIMEIPAPFTVIWSMERRSCTTYWFSQSGHYFAATGCPEDRSDSGFYEIDLETGEENLINKRLYVRDANYINGKLYMIESPNNSLSRIVARNQGVESVVTDLAEGGGGIEFGEIDGTRAFIQMRVCDGDSNQITKYDLISGNASLTINTPPCTLVFYTEDQIFVSEGSTGSSMQVFNKETGQKNWEWETSGSILEIGPDIAGTIENENRIFRGTKSGNILWEYDSPFNETPPKLLNEGLLFYVWGKPSGNRDLVLLNVSNGAEIWKRSDLLESRAGYYVHNGKIIILLEERILQIDPKTGATQMEWRREDLGIHEDENLSIVNGFMYGTSIQLGKITKYSLP